MLISIFLLLRASLSRQSSPSLFRSIFSICHLSVKLPFSHSPLASPTIMFPVTFSFYLLRACFCLPTFIFSISMLPLTLRVPSAGRAAFSPAVLLSQWLNIKRWQTPFPLTSLPCPSLPSPLPSSSPCFLTASFSSSFFSCSLPHRHVFPSSPRLAPPLSPFPLHPLLHNLRAFPQGLHLVAMVTKGPPNSSVLSCEG